jgi:tRNA 2-thiocytidine biosynthesis protein TtcA
MERKLSDHKKKKPCVEKPILRTVGKAVVKHSLIEENDRILVGISGGKDSYGLYAVLKALKSRAPIKFDLVPVLVKAGFEGENYDDLEVYLKDMTSDFHFEKTNIADLVNQAKGNPCSLCARLRRGVLYRMAEELKCNKIALGHHLDDAIETFLMNMSFSGKVYMMKPIYETEDKRFKVIRPLIHVPEHQMIEYSNFKEFPIVKQVCALNPENSRREQIKNTVTEMKKDNDYFYESFRASFEKLYPLQTVKGLCEPGD